MLISVIVTTYNRPLALERVLQGLSLQTDSDFEVVVADDGSGPQTKDLLARWEKNPKFRLTHAWQEDFGFRLNASRNNGIRHSSGDYIIVLDGDCIPRKTFVAEHRKLAENGWVVAGNRCLFSKRLTDQIEAGAVDVLGWNWTDFLAARVRGDINRLDALIVLPPDMAFRYKTAYKWTRLRGCNMGFFREDACKVNGFDESFTQWGLDDSDFAARLINAGIKIKSGCFATGVLHLFHKEGILGPDCVNRNRFDAVLAEKLTLPVKGLI